MRASVWTAISFFACTPVFAGVPLSWEECVAEVSRSSIELRSARETLASSGFLAKGAWSGFLPQVSASLSYSNGEGVVASSQPQASLSATQNLFSGFQDKAKVGQGLANQEVAESVFEATLARVSFELKSAFENLSYSHGALKLAQEIVRRRQENLRLVDLRFESGRENRGSVLLSKAYLAQAGLDELRATNSISVARADLAKVLGTRDDPEISGVVPTADPDESVDFRKLSLNTPDYRQAVAQEKSSNEAVTLARSAFFPSLILTSQANRQGNVVGATLGIPLFGGGRDYFSTRSAISLAAAASFNRGNLEQRLVTKLKQAFAVFLESVEKQKVDEAFYEAARVRAQIAKEKYNNGLLSFDDWDVIENDLVAREKNRLLSRRDRVLGEAAWEQALGKGVIR